MSHPKGYRDSLYIIKDIILTLSEYSQLNQTTLIRFCGLNLKKHRYILDELEKKEMIKKYEDKQGKRTISMYKTTQKGYDFCRNILEPYENVFPRKTKFRKDFKVSLLLLV